MSQPSLEPTPSRLTGTQWLICIIAAIGFLFDTYELLMAPLIVRPALAELLNAKPNSAVFNSWNGILFWVPTLTGGLFGLVGGYLTDLFGRRRMLVFSILLYAVSAFAAGFSTSIWMLLALRCTTMIGVCIEFVAAVAWLAELFPNPKQREAVLGFTQVFGSLGGLMVAEVNHLLPSFIDSLPAIYGPQEDVWRYTLISGLIPAIPLLVIRPFLPESPAWAAKKAAGTLRRPGLGQLFAPELRRTSILCAILFACTLGVAFGAIQQGPGIARAHPKVQALSDKEKGQIASRVQTYQELGGLAGRFAMAVLLVVVASRRRLLQLFLVPGLIVVPVVYMLPAWGHLDLFRWGVFLAGFLTIAQLSLWGNYLPAMYPVHLRGTGESFAANVGGRMVGAGAAMVTSYLALVPMGPTAGPGKLGIPMAAAIVGGAIYLLALIVSFWLPEPRAETAHA
jgi:MFS family permease